MRQGAAMFNLASVIWFSRDFCSSSSSEMARSNNNGTYLLLLLLFILLCFKLKNQKERSEVSLLTVKITNITFISLFCVLCKSHMFWKV